MTVTTDTGSESETRFTDLISGLRVAMFTTVEPLGIISSRPLTVQHVEDGHLFFVVEKDAEWLPLAESSAVAATLTDDRRWVSVYGTARVLRDRAAVDEVAGAAAQAWFRGDVEEQGAVLVLDSARVDYWTAPGKAAQIFAVAKGMLTGDGPDVGDRGTLEL